MRFILFVYRLIFPLKEHLLPEPKKVKKIVSMELEYKVDLIYKLKTGEQIQSNILPYDWNREVNLDLGYNRKLNLFKIDQYGLTEQEYNNKYVKLVYVKKFTNPSLDNAISWIENIDDKILPVYTQHKTVVGINVNDITTINATLTATREVEVVNYKVIENGEEEKTEAS
jgi:hypothetical protein